jgi:hypothetical protein
MDINLEKMQESARAQLQRLEDLEQTVKFEKEKTPRNDIERYFNFTNKNNQPYPVRQKRSNSIDRYDMKFLEQNKYANKVTTPANTKLRNTSVENDDKNDKKFEYLLNKIKSLDSKLLKLQAENITLQDAIKKPQNSLVGSDAKNKHLETCLSELQYHVEKLVARERDMEEKLENIK